MTDVTNLDSGVADDQEDDQVIDQAADTDDEDDDGDSGSQTDEDEDEYEELERGDKKYRIPKALKPELMMQADYTRKTQEAAAKERSLDEERAKWSSLNEEVVTAKIEEKAVKDRLSDLQSLTDRDWQEIAALDRQNGTNNYDKFMRELNVLPGRLGELEAKSKAKETEALNQKSAAQTKLIEQGQAILARDIPGWGPELGAKLVDFVKSEYGVDEARHGDAFMDPALVKMAHAAFQLKELQKKTTAQDRVKNLPKPIPQARGGPAPKAGLHDGLSSDEWFKREKEIQARKRNPQIPARA